MQPAKNDGDATQINAYRKPDQETDYPLLEDKPLPAAPPRPAPTTSLQAIAELAPSLMEAELRVLLELTRRAAGTPHNSVKISTRDLARAVAGNAKGQGVSRPWLIAALESLATRGLITSRKGTATAPSAHQLNFLSTIRIGARGGGSATEPPQTFDFMQGGSAAEPGVVPLRNQGGSVAEPPPADSIGLLQKAARVDTSDPIETLLDRVLKCKPKNFDPTHLAHFRNCLHSYMQQFGISYGRDGNRYKTPDAHPPDDEATAQFMACGEYPQLIGLLHQLGKERKECQTYGWFITMALSRIHHISYKTTEAAREQLRIVKGGQRQQMAPLHAHALSPPPDHEQEALFEGIQDLAEKKSMQRRR